MRLLPLAPVCLAVMLAPAIGLGADKLAPGDHAPAFSLVGSDGKTYQLEDFRDKQVVVLAWFPKAFTGGCTKECISFAEDGAAMRAYGAAYFTASVDPVEKNTKFAKSLETDYPILSDPGGAVARAYGVVDNLRPFPRRWTFLIGTDGKILAIDKAVKCETHATDVAASLEKLGVKKCEELNCGNP